MLIGLPGGRGVGKLEASDGKTATVAVFHSVARTERLEIPASSLERAYLSPQTRVYVRNEDRFQIGRVADYLQKPGGFIDYEIRFPNDRRRDVSETDLFLRPWTAPDDPAEVMAAGGAESQFLHDRRQSAMAELLRLRGAAQGLTALLSAGVDLAPHQAAAARQVLTDPVQRYLLADEVGLGKTIEAGLVVRQHLIDEPKTEVLIAVPRHLRDQWRQELITKLRLDQFGEPFEIIAHDEVACVRRAPDVLVVDEAHHLVGLHEGPLAHAADRLRSLASETPVLLLLSATPVLGDEARFLALLNLLDPASHPLDDLPGFRAKLESRRELGRVLLALNPDARGLVLRQRSADLLRLFPSDPVIVDLVPRLVAATQTSPGDLPSLCSALKSHVADGYRIHQRLIRSRRVDAQGWEFAARGPTCDGEPLFTHLRLESAGWVEPVLGLLEDWRVAALDASQGSERARARVADRYRNLLGAAAMGPASLLAWVGRAVLEEPFADEHPILEELAERLAEAEDDGLEVGAESLRRLLQSLREGVHVPKVVVFSSSVARAGSFHAALADRLGDVNVRLLPGDGAERDQAALDAFADPARTGVLVCGPTGEEGLNLAFADAILHLDVPLSAARIEQRIGRLDRFGRQRGIVRHRVLLPWDEEDSPWSGWLHLLSRGLSIFHRSISDVQVLIDEIEGHAFRVLLEQGPATMEALAAEVAARLADERRGQDEQYALDRVAMAEGAADSLVDSVEEAEADETALEAAIDAWLTGMLLFRKLPFAWPREDPFMLRAQRKTLVPRSPWIASLDLNEAKPLTCRRRIARHHRDASLVRPGTPLVDVLERYSRWDDRGTAYITRRTAPDWPGETWVGFRLNFVIEADLPVANLLTPSREELAAIRRAQRYFAPRLQVLHLDAEGTVVSDPMLLAILDRPYRNGERDGRRAPADLNLSSRPRLLAEEVAEEGVFADLCRSVREAGRNRILDDDVLAADIAAALALIDADLGRRRARLARSGTGDEDRLRIEVAVIEAIRAGMERPAVRLDSLGCFVVSRHPPSESHVA
ncbi:protein DpdE [Rubellimicrobium roseum]|uniref:DEAD/DEAH box helicase n=1 Tax=Rubellimicrobium roseum TaxID=687525 RepID=A0A5C4NK43_9RHOB|nr:protein DpdE [Rubellimicrobium roseum]TNC74350.1 hypothetical protein FHG71_03995 [Rubellimicrobium roseum]